MFCIEISINRGGVFMKNFLGIDDITREDIENILQKALQYKENTEDYSESLKYKNIISIFFENSTRTRTSFELAAKKMGANVINIDHQKSSMQKGETDLDTITNLNAMHPDAFVIRHSHSGYPMFISKISDVPVINAGDGSNEHPSQAILDLMTMYEVKHRIENLNVCIIGDILNSRVARSHMKMAKKLNWNLSICGPKTMLPKQEWINGIKIEHSLENAIKNKDFIILLRIQLERKSGSNLSSLQEYSRFFGLRSGAIIPDNTYIMHPGPVNRDIEISSDLLDTHNNILVTKQVQNGIFARMAIYDFCLN